MSYDILYGNFRCKRKLHAGNYYYSPWPSPPPPPPWTQDGGPAHKEHLLILEFRSVYNEAQLGRLVPGATVFARRRSNR